MIVFDPAIPGPSWWAMGHSLANEMDQMDQPPEEDMKFVWDHFADWFPCLDCREHYQDANQQPETKWPTSTTSSFFKHSVLRRNDVAARVGGRIRTEDECMKDVMDPNRRWDGLLWIAFGYPTTPTDEERHTIQKWFQIIGKWLWPNLLTAQRVQWNSIVSMDHAFDSQTDLFYTIIALRQSIGDDRRINTVEEAIGWSQAQKSLDKHPIPIALAAAAASADDDAQARSGRLGRRRLEWR